MESSVGVEKSTKSTSLPVAAVATPELRNCPGPSVGHCQVIELVPQLQILHFALLPCGSDFLCQRCPAGSTEGSPETLPVVRKLEKLEHTSGTGQPPSSSAAVLMLFIPQHSKGLRKGSTCKPRSISKA